VQWEAMGRPCLVGSDLVRLVAALVPAWRRAPIFDLAPLPSRLQPSLPGCRPGFGDAASPDLRTCASAW
jgi:hypothetical protein